MKIEIELKIAPSQEVIALIAKFLGADEPAQQTEKKPGRPRKEADKAGETLIPVINLPEQSNGTKGIELEPLRALGNAIVEKYPDQTAAVKKIINDHGAANFKTLDAKEYQAVWNELEELQKSLPVKTEL